MTLVGGEKVCLSFVIKYAPEYNLSSTSSPPTAGIDTLNLIKDAATMEQEKQAAMQQQMQNSLVNQAGQLAKSPIGEELTNQMMNNGTEENTEES